VVTRRISLSIEETNNVNDHKGRPETITVKSAIVVEKSILFHFITLRNATMANTRECKFNFPLTDENKRLCRVTFPTLVNKYPRPPN
jgi:hypothetical protein